MLLLARHIDWVHLGSCSRLVLQQQRQQRPCAAPLRIIHMPAQQRSTCTLTPHATASDQKQGEEPQQGPWTSNSSSSTRQQQDRDSPDMGRRAKRRVKVPLPKQPSQSRSPGSAKAAEPATAADFAAAADSAAEGIDPEASGFKERALLLGLLESMDPSTRSQFEQYMEMQLHQVEQDQQQAAAVDFLQAALDKAADKALNPEQHDNTRSNPTELFESEEGNAVMWQALREQFNAEEVAVLDGVLGSDWASFGARALQPDTVARISSLDVRQQALLADVLSKISGMTGQMETFASRLERAEQAPSSNNNKTNNSSSSSSSSSSRAKSSWGSSFRKKRSQRVRSKGSREAAAAQHYWDTLLDGDMAAKVQKVMELTGQAARGQLQYGLPPSRHLRALQQIHQQMLQLETRQVQQPGSIPAADVAAAYASINAQLNSLVAQGDEIEDTATRSALLYMDALFNSSSEGDAVQPSSSSSSSSSSNPQLQQQQHQKDHGLQVEASSQQSAAEPSSSSGGRGAVSLQKLQRLGKFLKAAGNLKPFQTLLSVLSEKQPHLASQEMLWLSNLGGDDWFVKPELQDQAYTAAQAAAEAHAMLEAGTLPRSSSSSTASAVSTALLPFVDESRIEALAAVEPDTLWFMAELAANDFDEDVLLKWSLHPTVGQRMTSGNWLNEVALPQQLKELYAQAQVPDFMSALNFDIQQQQQQQQQR
ncbi:hypothetical protein COO60DRAFT_794085 [Scenedesmus sp. NREL 46B-D3]|nr:hypothetical protein COO60DRAFT_794085 [Scenedesmus sp. NREL 46B-D3]